MTRPIRPPVAQRYQLVTFPVGRDVVVAVLDLGRTTPTGPPVMARKFIRAGRAWSTFFLRRATRRLGKQADALNAANVQQDQAVGDLTKSKSLPRSQRRRLGREFGGNP